MKKRQSSKTKEKILNATSQIIQTQGITSLTLEAAAKEAGVSKGGLLYHFPNKDSLISGLIDRLIESFEAILDRETGTEEAIPGHFTRSYIRASVAFDKEFLEMSSGLLAASGSNPELLTLFRDSYERWQAKLETDQINPAIATIIRLAIDGLWFAKMFDLAPPTEVLQIDVLTKLTKLTRGTEG